MACPQQALLSLVAKWPPGGKERHGTSEPGPAGEEVQHERTAGRLRDAAGTTGRARRLLHLEPFSEPALPRSPRMPCATVRGGQDARERTGPSDREELHRNHPDKTLTL